MQSPTYNCGLANSWNRHNQLGYAKERRDCKCHGLRRDFVCTFEPTFRNLLPLAVVVQIHDLHVKRIIEICDAGIVECKMSVFSNAQQTKLRTSLAHRLSVHLAFCFRIWRTSIDFKESMHPHELSQVGAQVFAEGGF